MKDSEPSRRGMILFYLESMTEEEIAVLKVMGRLNVSVKKNIAVQTIHKKLPDKYLKVANKTINSLSKDGFIIKYRKENVGLSQKGRDVANYIVDQDLKKKNRDLRLLLLLK